ncbi:MAG TPA: hypothetical protein VMF03_02755 [Steroidobacteraceae bacterium]|nr:hypothetical protein [Steroidobacteraceae bacterium]
MEPGYLRNLSPASLQTLQLQGGPMNHAEALRVRRWDDRAKIADLKVPDLASYRHLIDQQARRCRREAVQLK